MSWGINAIWFYFSIQETVSPASFIEYTIFSQQFAMPLLSYSDFSFIYGFASGLSILFLWSICLSLVQKSTILITYSFIVTLSLC